MFGSKGFQYSESPKKTNGNSIGQYFQLFLACHFNCLQNNGPQPTVSQIKLIACSDVMSLKIFLTYPSDLTLSFEQYPSLQLFQSQPPKRIPLTLLRNPFEIIPVILTAYHCRYRNDPSASRRLQ